MEDALTVLGGSELPRPREEGTSPRGRPLTGPPMMNSVSGMTASLQRTAAARLEPHIPGQRCPPFHVIFCAAQHERSMLQFCENWNERHIVCSGGDDGTPTTPFDRSAEMMFCSPETERCEQDTYHPDIRFRGAFLATSARELVHMFCSTAINKPIYDNGDTV